MANNKERIRRSPRDKQNPYVQTRRDMVQNNKMSWKARAILTYLLSLPDDWVIVISHLIDQATDNETSLRSGLKELIAHKYMQNFKVYENGKISHGEYMYSETPFEDDEIIKSIIINDDKTETINYYSKEKIEKRNKELEAKIKRKTQNKKKKYTKKSTVDNVDNKNENIDGNSKEKDENVNGTTGNTSVDLNSENLNEGFLDEEKVNEENKALQIKDITKEIFVLNKQQQQKGENENVVVVDNDKINSDLKNLKQLLGEDISDESLKVILVTAINKKPNGYMEYIKEKHEIVKIQGCRNLVGSLIDAINKDYKNVKVNAKKNNSGGGVFAPSVTTEGRVAGKSNEQLEKSLEIQNQIRGLKRKLEETKDEVEIENLKLEINDLIKFKQEVLRD